MLEASELILNPDGSVYHLNLLPHEVASTIITVGDPQRVGEVSKHFDEISFKKECREFFTHTGTYKGKRLTVISTGIGTDNIDIAFNELDALFNIDLKTRKINKIHSPINFIRIGTSGCLQADVPVDSFLFSSGAMGLDVLGGYYPDFEKDEVFAELINSFLAKHKIDIPFHYYVDADASLLQHFVGDHHKGISITCPGFYGPQGRSLRLNNSMDVFLNNIDELNYNSNRFTNFEMETAGIYLLAKLLGHKAVSCNVLLANRKNGTFSKAPKDSTESLIQYCLNKITQF